MESTKSTFSEYFRQVSIVHYLLLGGALIFILVSVFLVSINFIDPLDEDVQMLAMAASIVLLFAGMIVVFLLSKRKLNDLNNNALSVYEKLLHYRSVLIFRAAITEMIAFGVTLIFLLTANHIVLGVAVICFAVLVFIRPTRDRLIMELQLEKKDFA
jgi:hypothetical protein